jgi:hypothetical protein
MSDIPTIPPGMTCQQLEARKHLLMNLWAHVRDPDRSDEISQELAAIYKAEQERGCFSLIPSFL